MKRILVILTLLLFFFIGNSATYYVSTTGLDSNNGLSSLLPFRTISKVNSLTLAAGDSIKFKRGEIWYEGLAASNSGNSSARIVYCAYGTGEQPIISGMKVLTGWTLHTTGIYKVSDSSIPSSCDVVTINNISTPMGRYPKTDLVFESYSGTTSITDVQLTNSPNFTGAEVVIYKSNWILDRSVVSNHTNSTVTYTSGSSYSPDNTGGSKYFFQKSIDCLTQFGDWYCDGTNFYMFFGASSPSSYTVKAGLLNQTITASKNYLTFRDLTVEGGNAYGIYSTLNTNLSLINLTIKNAGFYGFWVNASTNTIVDGCTFSYINGTGASVQSDNGIVKNSTFDHCGAFAGMGNSNGSSYMGLNIRASNGVTEYNRFTEIGYVGVYFYGNNHQVRYNVVDGSCRLGLIDGAAIYTYYGLEDNAQSGMKVHNNIVLNSLGNGLYPDNLSNNQEWYNNTVINVGKYGIHSNMPVNCSIHNNTFYGFGLAAIDIQNLTAQTTPASGNTISQNICVQSSADQELFSLQDNRTNQTMTVPFGTSNSNKFIVGASATTIFYASHVLPSYQVNYYSFEDWKTLTGQESLSTVSIKNLSDITIKYNDTSSEKSFSLTGVQMDLTGTIYQESITLQPYTSIILIEVNVTTVQPKPWFYNGIWIYNDKFLNGN